MTEDARAQAVLDYLNKKKMHGEEDFAGNPEVLERVRAFEAETFSNMRTASIASAKSDDIERLALLDNLTDLYNYRTFIKELKAELSRAGRYKQPVSLILMGIDNFETVQQQFGNLSSDAVLRIMGSVVRGAIRELDIPAKYDFQSFAVILPQTQAPMAAFIGERIRQRVGNQSISYNWHNFSVTASIGVSTFPIHANSHDKLIARATEAQQFAALRGGDRVFCV